MQNHYDNQVNFAGFFVRLTAYILDCIIVGTLLLAVKIPFKILFPFYDMKILFSYTAADIIFYILTVMYFILFTYFKGYTPGKRIMNIRVVDEDRKRLSFFQVVYRETVGRFLSGVIIGAGYLMIVIDNKKRSLHDMLSDTRVIYAH